MRIAISILSLAGCLALAPEVAWASPPCQCEYAWSLPDNEATGVPTNARIFVWWPGASMFKLSSTQDPGTEMPIEDLDAAGQLDGRWIVPLDELTPQTEYSLVSQRRDGSRYSLRWTTGAGPDQTPPLLGAVAIRPGVLSGACWSHKAAVVSVTGVSDDLTEAGGLLIQVDLVDPRLEPGTSTVFLQPRLPVMGDSGPVTCLNNAPGVQPDLPYTATVRVLDWAGNPSAVSESIGLTFRDNSEAGGCACAAGGRAGRAANRLGWLALAAALLGLARRRRVSADSAVDPEEPAG